MQSIFEYSPNVRRQDIPCPFVFSVPTEGHAGTVAVEGIRTKQTYEQITQQYASTIGKDNTAIGAKHNTLRQQLMEKFNINEQQAITMMIRTSRSYRAT
jgi:hypothetical protein